MRSRNGQVETVLGDLSPGLKVLEDQRGQLVEMLRELEKLSDVAVKTINASKDDTAANLRSLAVVLRKLADSGRNRRSRWRSCSPSRSPTRRSRPSRATT